MNSMGIEMFIIGALIRLGMGFCGYQFVAKHPRENYRRAKWAVAIVLGLLGPYLCMAVMCAFFLYFFMSGDLDPMLEELYKEEKEKIGLETEENV